MQQLKIQTTYGMMRVFKKGNGEKIVLLLHGAGCDHALLSWREVLGQFDEGYTVYAPDLLGYGLSDDIRLTGDFYERYIGSLKELVDALELNQFVIAGLSMGGALALAFSLNYPEHVVGCIPVNTWGVSASMPMHRLSYWYIQHTNFTMTQYQWVAKSKWLAKWFIQYALIGEKTYVTDALVQEVIEACKGAKAGESMQAFQRSSVTKTGTIPFFDEALQSLKMPVVFVHGENDPLVALQDVKQAVQQTPNAQLIVFGNCKHWSVKEKPREFVEVVGAIYT